MKQTWRASAADPALLISLKPPNRQRVVQNTAASTRGWLSRLAVASNATRPCPRSALAFCHLAQAVAAAGLSLLQNTNAKPYQCSCHAHLSLQSTTPVSVAAMRMRSLSCGAAYCWMAVSASMTPS